MFLPGSLKLYLNTFPESIPLSSVIIFAFLNTFRFFCHRNFLQSPSLATMYYFLSCSCLLTNLLHSFLPSSFALATNFHSAWFSFPLMIMPSSKVQNKSSQPVGFTRLCCQIVQFKRKKTYIVLQNCICSHHKIRISLEF